MRCILFFFFILTSGCNAFAQTKDNFRLKADSIEQTLPSLKENDKIAALRKLGEYYTHNDAGKAIAFYRQAIQEGEAISYPEQNLLHSGLGFSYVVAGKYDSAEIHVNKAISLTPAGDKTLANVYLTAGNLYVRSERYAEALTSYLNALEVAKTFNNEELQLRSYVNTGVVYEMLKDYASAIRYDSMGYNMAVKLNSRQSGVVALSNWAEHTHQAGNLDRAMVLFRKAEKDAQDLPNSQYTLALIHVNLAEVHFKKGKIDSALYYGLKSAEAFKIQQPQTPLDAAYKLLSRIEIQRRNLLKAKEYAILVYNSAKENKLNQDIKESAFLLMKINRMQGNLDVADQYEEEMNAVSVLIEKENHTKAVLELQTKYDTEKKEHENALLKKENETQQYVTLLILVVLVLVIGLLVVAYRNYLNKQKANVLLSEHQQEIEIQNHNLKEALEELQTTQEQLVQSEKMASLGQMTAGIAHEINNPLTFIQTGVSELESNLKHVQRVMHEYDSLSKENFDAQLKKIESIKKEVYYNELYADLETLIKTVKVGSSRTAAIISGLQRFSRKDKEDYSERDLAEVIDDTLILIHGETKNRIQIIRDYQAGLKIECRPVELGQVLMNLLINATHAIKGTGTITVKTERINQEIKIVVKDTGEGIPKENLSRIFDPFFTTKEVGKGTGLGLSISHGIIQSHQGEIAVASTVGQGTEFIITLPARYQAKA